MRVTLFSAALLLLAGLAIAQNHNAPVVTGDNLGGTWCTKFSSNVTGVRGYIQVAPNWGGGLVVVGYFLSLPPAGGPFEYAIHERPVSGGSCGTAGGRLDPFGRGEQPPCNPASPETCQIGDLSGKHGKVSETTTTGGISIFDFAYTDRYLTADPRFVQFVGGKAVVIRSSTGARLACANLPVNSIENPCPPVTL